MMYKNKSIHRKEFEFTLDPTLQQIYNEHKKGEWPDKGSVHSYIEVYEELLKPYRHTAQNVLEIGLMSGESLRMWDEYFEGTVYGIDCYMKPANPYGGKAADLTGAIEEGYKIFIGDAGNPADVEKHFKGIMFDVVIEDANHNVEQQLQIYDTIKPYLNEGAIYIIEDVRNIDLTWNCFKSLGGEIIDRRKIKNRSDDVLIIIK